jgi:hypothetical protein
MNKNSNHLVSLTMLALSLGICQSGLSMESNQTLLGVTPFITSRDESFKHGPFYHPAATEQYRAAVQALRREIFQLQEQLSSSGANGQYGNVEKEIKEIEKKLSLHREASQKYGKDKGREAVKQEIRTEINEQTKFMEEAEQNKVSKPSMKALYEGQITKTSETLEKLKEYLHVLDKSENALQNELDMTKGFLKQLEQQSSSSQYTKEAISEKINEIHAMYEKHVKGQCIKDIFPHDLPKALLKELGIALSQVNSLETERLFALFARTLELPCFVIQTGEDMEEAYARHLKVVAQNLRHRLNEDVFSFQLGCSIAQSGKVVLNFKEQDKQLEKLATNAKDLKSSSEQTIAKDLEVFKNILSTYGYQDQKQSSLSESVIRQSPYGLLGLCIGALECQPITSWNEMGNTGLALRMKSAGNAQEFAACVVENVYSILGRHINKQALQRIEEALQAKPTKPSAPESRAF